MRIEDIRIERFGRWNELTLSLPDPSINVLYGPNEAGKSTLLRFVRGVLYGRGDGTDTRAPGSLRGRLVVERDGVRHTLERQYDEQRDRVDVDSFDRPDAELADLLQGIDRPLFESVFAVGLREMQELGTLDDERVGEWLYGTSLGPAGRRLGEVSGFASDRRSTLLGSGVAERRGRIADLTAEYARLSREIDAIGGPGRHDDLRGERDELEATIDRLRRRQNDAQRDLRGHRLLARVHAPWRQVREYRDELARIGRVGTIPEDGLGSLSRIEARIDEIRDERKRAATNVKRLIADYKNDGEADGFGEHTCTLRALLEQRDEIHDVQRRIGEIGGRLRGARTEFDAALEGLGHDWNERRVAGIDNPREGQTRLNLAARTYQKALVRRARLRRLRKRLARAVKKRQAELHERTRALGGRSVKDAIADRRQRLVDLEDLGRLRVRAAELEQRRKSLTEQAERTRTRSALPDWVYGVLVFFAITGGVFCLLGLATSIATSALVGAIYAFLGMTCGGLAWAIKVHFEEELRDTLRQLRDDEHATEVQLRETHERIALLYGPDDEHPMAVAATLQQQQERDAEILSQTVRELVDLERLQERIEDTVRLRKRQTIVRGRFHSLQRELGQARQEWLESLRGLGLTETLKIDDAMTEWDRVSAAVDARRRLRIAEGELTRERENRERFRVRLRRLADALGEDYEDERALEMLDRWERLLDGRNEWSDRRRQLRRDIRAGRREYDRLKNELSKWRRRRDTLLGKAGVGSRDEFERIAGSIGRRRELEELLALAEADLETATRGDEDLAIVEEQLFDYDPDASAEAIELAELELEEIDGQLRAALERLGHVKKSVADVEGDDRSATLRFERERVYEELRDATRDLAAAELVGRSADAAIGDLERSHQPPALAAASRYLAKLTLGRYDRIWTPFGESRLLVNGGGREAFSIEQLSRGTREQVFLALRLAMIERLSDEGVRLPFVLDDVLVNFDRDRTEAAVDTLMDFAADGRQVLFFTCHVHVAEMFEHRGVEPVWLPSSDRVEERIAG